MIYLTNTVSAQTVSIPRNDNGGTPSINPRSYQEGYNAGEAHQKSLLSSTAITENGEYQSENGYSAITVNVPQTGTTSILGEGSFSANGTYSASTDNLDGYSAITIDVPTGISIDLSSITITANTAITETDKAYTGITVNVPQTGHTDQEMEEAYDSGYINGYSSGNTDGYSSGYTEGVDFQKAALTSVTISQNGEYVRENGYSAITVNVSGSPIVLELQTVDLNDGFDPDLGMTVTPSSGYNGLSEVIISDGGYSQTKYDEGYMDGQSSMADEYQKGYNDGYDIGYTSGETDGYASGYSSGETVGYNSGYTNGYVSGETVGENNIISTFSAITATTNGVYGSSANPLSAVTVNVPTGTTNLNSLWFASNGVECSIIPDNGYFTISSSSNVTNRTYTIVRTNKQIPYHYKNKVYVGSIYNAETGSDDETLLAVFYNTSTNEFYVEEVRDFTSYTTATSGNQLTIQIIDGKVTNWDGMENGNYDGLSYVNVEINSAKTYNDGRQSIISTFSSTTATTNGIYGSTGHPLSSITVNVPQTGYTQQDLDNAYDSGYTSGETNGYNSGLTDGYASGYTSGYNSGYTSGLTVSYDSGVTDGSKAGLYYAYYPAVEGVTATTGASYYTVFPNLEDGKIIKCGVLSKNHFSDYILGGKHLQADPFISFGIDNINNEADFSITSEITSGYSLSYPLPISGDNHYSIAYMAISGGSYCFGLEVGGYFYGGFNPSNLNWTGIGISNEYNIIFNSDTLSGMSLDYVIYKDIETGVVEHYYTIDPKTNEIHDWITGNDLPTYDANNTRVYNVLQSVLKI